MKKPLRSEGFHLFLFCPVFFPTFSMYAWTAWEVPELQPKNFQLNFLSPRPTAVTLILSELNLNCDR